MTILPSSDDAVSAVLDASPDAGSALEHLWRSNTGRAPRGVVARALGRNPLADGSRDWFKAAVGEADLAERLRTLGASGESWRVLHSVPVGGGAPDVDHVVIGPAGVFTLLTFDGGTSLLAAQAAARALEAALGRPVAVHPLVVVVGGATPPAFSPLAEVTVLAASQVARHLRRLPPVLNVEEVREVTRAALRPRTWQPRRPADPGPASWSPLSSTTTPPQPAPASPGPDLQPWFGRLRAEVRRAEQVRAAWIGGLLVAFAAAVATGPAIAGTLLP